MLIQKLETLVFLNINLDSYSYTFWYFYPLFHQVIDFLVVNGLQSLIGWLACKDFLLVSLLCKLLALAYRSFLACCNYTCPYLASFLMCLDIIVKRILPRVSPRKPLL